MIVDQKQKGKIVGVYVIGSVKNLDAITTIATVIKPNWFRRACTWMFMGWTWIDVNKAKDNGII